MHCVMFPYSVRDSAENRSQKQIYLCSVISFKKIVQKARDLGSGLYLLLIYTIISYVSSIPQDEELCG